MGKHRTVKCEICSKEMRSDKLKNHMLSKHSTPKKKKEKTPNIKVNRSPTKKNMFIVTEAEHSSESEREEEETETDQDRLFIDDSHNEVSYIQYN